jgi:hypothetical protein
MNNLEYDLRNLLIMEYVMNKKRIIVTISLVLIVAVIAVLIIYNDYPENGEEIAAGSIGKVEKYREANIQDMILNYELIS